MKVFDTVRKGPFPPGIAVLVMNSIVDIIAVESSLHTSDSGKVRKAAGELKAIRESYVR